MGSFLWAACCALGLILSISPLAELHAQQPVTVRLAATSQPGEPLPAPGPPQVLPAPEAGSLTLVDLEQIALANNPSLGRAAALVAAARGNWIQVGLGPNPLVGYMGYQLGSGGLAEQQGVLMEKEFITGHKLKLNREVASQEIMQAEQRLAAQQQRVLTDIRMAFTEALVAQRKLGLAEELAQIMRQGSSTAERLLNAEQISQIDVLQVNLEAESAEGGLQAARARHSAVWRHLTSVAGVPQMRPERLDGNLEALPQVEAWEHCLGRLLASSPEIAAAVIEIDRARWALTRARAEPIPNMRVQATVMQDNAIGGKTDGNLEMLFPLPLLNKNQGAIRQAEAHVVAAEQALGQLELELQHRLAPVYEKYASAAGQVQQYRERVLPFTQQSRELVRRGHEGGAFTYLQLLASQQKYVQTQLQYLDLLRELHLSAAEIEGLLLRDSLSATP
jgi:cobalt-zinc-cadmium efflux system outer membrane protein